MTDAQRARLRERVIRLGAGAVALAVVTAAVIAFRITFNFSDSMPIGFYALSPVTATVAPGRIVAVCPPDAVASLGLRRRYLQPGACSNGSAYLLKIVAAAAGDRVDLRDHGVYVNDKHLPGSGTLVTDRVGRRMPRIARGTYVLHPGEVWLWTPNPRSWDSRYYGPVTYANVIGFATLILPIGGWPYADVRG